MNDREKLERCILALRVIALSYRERIDRDDTPAYVFADEILKSIGEDIETLPSNEETTRGLWGGRQ